MRTASRRTRRARHQVLDFSRVVGEHDYRNIEADLSYFGGKLPRTHIADADMFPRNERRYQSNTVEEREGVDEAEHVACKQSADTW